MFVIIFVKGIVHFLLGKTCILNLCLSIFVFSTVYCDKIFKHWLKFLFDKLRVSFFLNFCSQKDSLKMVKEKVNIQVRKIDRRLLTLFKPFSEVKRFRDPKWALTELRCKMEFCQIATRVYLKKLSFLYIGYKIKVIKTSALSLPRTYTCLTLVRTLKSRNMAKATKTDYISRENFRPQLFKTWLTLSTW